jgi:hypothetical protein
MSIKVNDYIEGFEYFGQNIKSVKGWVDSIRIDKNETIYNIQADDSYDGHRGTTIFSSNRYSPHITF